jgi:hypothetical protein
VGTVTTDRIIRAPWTIENHSAPGTFGMVSRDPSQTILITLNGEYGGERVELVRVGDSMSIDLRDVDTILIEAAVGYPTEALINFTNLDIELDAAPFVTVVSGPSTFSAHFDATIAGAGTTALWTPTAGKRFVISSFMLSTDTQNRVALVDGADTAGHRIAAPYLAAEGGMVGGPYASQAINNILKVVTLAGGNVFASVDGYESAI